MCAPSKPPPNPLTPAIADLGAAQLEHAVLALEHVDAALRAAPRRARRGGRRASRGCRARRGSGRRARAPRAATIAACSGSPCVVRSPASRTRSTRSRRPANAAAQRSSSPVAAEVDVAGRGDPDRALVARLACRRRSPSGWPCRGTVPGYERRYDRPTSRPFADIEATLKKAASALRGADVPFLLGRQPRLVGARRPRDAPRPRPDDQARGRRARARGADRRPGCAPRTRPRSGSSRRGMATCSST